MGEYQVHMLSDAASVGTTRQALTRFADNCGFTGEALNDIKCAVGEGLANATEHGGRPGSTLAVRAALEGGALVVEIVDEGDGFSHCNASDFNRPLSNAPRGYGIFIMRELMDEITYTDHGRALRLVKRFPTAR